MLAYLIRRTLQIIGVMLGVSFICFIVFQYTGDPVLTITGTQEVTQQQIEEVRKKDKKEAKKEILPAQPKESTNEEEKIRKGVSLLFG